MKPLLHARSSARKYGGEPDEYLAIHDFIDGSKAALPDVRHRAIFHSAFGCFVVEKVFGTYFVNSAGRQVSVRDIAEDHILEDLGFIPTLEKWFVNMPIERWMGGKASRVRQMALEDLGRDAPVELPPDTRPGEAILQALEKTDRHYPPRVDPFGFAVREFVGD